MTNNFMQKKKGNRRRLLSAFELVYKPSEGWPSAETVRLGVWNLAFSFWENTGLLMFRCL